jgi:hypothetical protein
MCDESVVLRSSRDLEKMLHSSPSKKVGGQEGKKERRRAETKPEQQKLIGLVEAADPFFTKSTTVVRRRSESRLLAC